MTKPKDLKKRFMEDPEFREQYARVDEEYALVEALVGARTAAKLTQAAVARPLGTTQSAIARVEGGQVSPSFAMLRRHAEATGTLLTIAAGRNQSDNACRAVSAPCGAAPSRDAPDSPRRRPPTVTCEPAPASPWGALTASTSCEPTVCPKRGSHALGIGSSLSMVPVAWRGSAPQPSSRSRRRRS